MHCGERRGTAGPAWATPLAATAVCPTSACRGAIAAATSLPTRGSGRKRPRSMVVRPARRCHRCRTRQRPGGSAAPPGRSIHSSGADSAHGAEMASALRGVRRVVEWEFEWDCEGRTFLTPHAPISLLSHHHWVRGSAGQHAATCCRAHGAFRCGWSLRAVSRPVPHHRRAPQRPLYACEWVVMLSAPRLRRWAHRSRRRRIPTALARRGGRKVVGVAPSAAPRVAVSVVRCPSCGAVRRRACQSAVAAAHRGRGRCGDGVGFHRPRRRDGECGGGGVRCAAAAAAAAGSTTGGADRRRCHVHGQQRPEQRGAG